MTIPTGLTHELAQLHALAAKLDHAANVSVEYPDQLDDLPGYVLHITGEQRAALYRIGAHLHKLGLVTLPDASTSSEDEV